MVWWRHVMKSRTTRFFLPSFSSPRTHASEPDHLASPCLVSPCFALLCLASSSLSSAENLGTDISHTFIWQGRQTPTLPNLGLPHGPKKAPRVDDERPVSQPEIFRPSEYPRHEGCSGARRVIHRTYGMGTMLRYSYILRIHRTYITQ
ncbi:hypothetical protein LX32DRAFT_375159 [Colletotrichum zoysiae]|uniref:Uncharacterized protein n=1 Tax=Colletotrichum zoysiae TaxID=1216348 RepID=A0AAD9M966_9PEZI|nr:hypothetical protein LX32DRAFT_375159 [Colletotrichum zoysiae]